MTSAADQPEVFKVERQETDTLAHAQIVWAAPLDMVVTFNFTFGILTLKMTIEISIKQRNPIVHI